MDGTVITSLATLHLQIKSRLLATAWCPDKDLLVIISRYAKADRMSLWKMQGSKIWEVDVDPGDGSEDMITALSWGPDGQTIVVAHHPPRISFHSIQDGHEERSLIVGPQPGPSSPRISELWWSKKNSKNPPVSFPDLLKRAGNVPGSAPSILSMLPLLDPLPDESQPMPTDQFVFNTTHPRPSAKPSAVPQSIASWPSLPSDPLLASIKPPPHLASSQTGGFGDIDETDNSNVDSLLTAIDISGNIHCYLDGYYSMGIISLGSSYSAKSLIKDMYESCLYVYAERTPFQPPQSRQQIPSPSFKNLLPIAISLPLLDHKSARQVAVSCSIARQLLWYVMRVIKEMRRTWIGEEGHEGARDVNTHWFIGYMDYLTHYGHGGAAPEGKETSALLDVTCLLTSGRESVWLGDYLSSSEHTSERGLQRWENTVTEALTSLCNLAEMRVAPALQRLHLVLEDVKGCSLLPDLYSAYEFSTAEVNACLESTARGVTVAAWLAAETRLQLARFKEFMFFIRYEVNKHQTNTGDILSGPKHDVLDVNEYLMSGLVNNPLDKWFDGPAPSFSVEQMIETPEKQDLSVMMSRTSALLADPKGLIWPPMTRSKDHSHLDRNLIALVESLASSCQGIFDRSSKAVTKSSKIHPMRSNAPNANDAPPVAQPYEVVPGPARPLLEREKVICDDKEPGKIVHHLAIRVPNEDGESQSCQELLMMIRSSSTHSRDYSSPSAIQNEISVSVAILECTMRNEAGSAFFNVPGGEFVDDTYVLDMAFFDERSLVVVYRLNSPEQGAVSISLMDYSELEYQDLDMSAYHNGTGPSREHIVAEAMTRKRTGQLSPIALPLRKKRGLVVGTKGGVTLAVNGRVGRRVACVLDEEGMGLEVLDMEGEEEEQAGQEEEPES